MYRDPMMFKPHYRKRTDPQMGDEAGAVIKMVTDCDRGMQREIP